jgi:hypothetical protein
MQAKCRLRGPLAGILAVKNAARVPIQNIVALQPSLIPTMHLMGAVGRPGERGVMQKRVPVQVRISRKEPSLLAGPLQKSRAKRQGATGVHYRRPLPLQ